MFEAHLYFHLVALINEEDESLKLSLVQEALNSAVADMKIRLMVMV